MSSLYPKTNTGIGNHDREHVLRALQWVLWAIEDLPVEVAHAIPIEVDV